MRKRAESLGSMTSCGWYAQGMRVQVLYFGMLKECFGAESDAAELAEDSSVEDLLLVLRERAQGAAAAWSSMAVAVNREYAGRTTVLRDGDEVALLPPVSGGVW